MRVPFNPTASFRQCFTTGAVTGVAAGTATAGHILALRNPAAATRAIRVRSIEAEFLVTTAFTVVQEIGFDASIARSYTVAHTGETALDLTASGKKIASDQTATLTGRIANTAALVAGTHTLDANAIVRASLWASAVGVSLSKRYDLSLDPGGIYLAANEGLILRNTIAMSLAGAGKWHFTVDWDEGILNS